MRILHTSDWHIGRQLHGVSLLEDQAHVLDQIVEIAEREEVDAVIIAGDVYDRAIPPAEAVRLLGQTLTRFCIDLGKQVIVIAGNHDSGDRLGFGADLMGSSGLHIVGPLVPDITPITLDKDGFAVDVFGLPFAGPLTVRNVFDEEVSTHEEAMAVLLDKTKEQAKDDRATIIAAHCFVDGAEESESERPLSVGGADRISASLFEPFNYAALGHLHRPQSREKEHIRYSGSVLKYSFSEVDHQKSVTLVDVDTSGAISIREVGLQPLRDLRVIEGSLEEILTKGETDPGADDYIKAIITDKQALLDVMGKLRQVYPNVLQMEKIGLAGTSPQAGQGSEMLRKNHMRLFEDFFEEIHEEPLNDQQRAYMEKVFDAVGAEDVA